MCSAFPVPDRYQATERLYKPQQLATNKMMGIDTVIGLASLAIAIPGLVQTCVHAGRYLSSRLRSGPDTAETAFIKDFVLQIQCGSLRTILESVEDLYCSTSDGVIQQSLHENASFLWAKILALEQQIMQINTAALEEKQLKKAKNRALEEIQSFQNIAEALRKYVQDQVAFNLLPSRLQLRPRQFSVVGDLVEPPHASVKTCSADFNTMDRKGTIPCVVEEKTFPGLSSVQAYGEAVALARILQFADEGQGILELVGFQVLSTSPLAHDRFRLIFTFPPGYARARSLRDILVDPINQPESPIPRNYRFILPRKLADAVYQVHQQNLVHKCIRPESILLFEPEGDSSSLKYPSLIGKPFLTDWRHVRSTVDASMQHPFHNWTMALYQHPERQADPASITASKYHIGHDIYSLGVCLLEIGLWESFVVDNGAGPAISNRLADAKAKWISENAVFSQSMKDSQIEQKAFILLATGSLAYEMGELYSMLVVKCLTCVEQGFGNVRTFVDSSSRDWYDQGVLFIQAIQQELARASTMGVGTYNRLL